MHGKNSNYYIIRQFFDENNLKERKTWWILYRQFAHNHALHSNKYICAYSRLVHACGFYCIGVIFDILVPKPPKYFSSSKNHLMRVPYSGKFSWPKNFVDFEVCKNPRIFHPRINFLNKVGHALPLPTRVSLHVFVSHFLSSDRKSSRK